MPTAELAFAVFDRLLAVLGLVREGRKVKSERTDQALNALYVALNETKSYVDRLDSGGRRSRSSEFEIAHLWQMASIPLRELDPDLALRCFIKGGYWLKPSTYTSLKVRKQRIGLDQVLDSTRELLLRH